VHERPALNCWRLPLKPDWEDYLHTLGSTRRNLVRKLTRRTFDSGRAVLRWVDGEDEFEHGWRILVDLHQRRRRSLGQRGCFSCPNFAAFLKLAARRFLRLGRLRLQWVELDGRPVVCELDFAGDQIVYLYQSGMDPDLTSERPGWLGTIAALRRAAADGFAAFDFLRGDEPYKAHWRAVPRPLVDYRIVATTARSRAHHMLWRAREEAKKQVKFLLRFYQGRRERRYGAATKDHRERQSPELPSPRES
jgi:CelD/BcsL family acetyltransferase involved in cellulose biosynthesis